MPLDYEPKIGHVVQVLRSKSDVRAAVVVDTHGDDEVTVWVLPIPTDSAGFLMTVGHWDRKLGIGWRGVQ